ncbi:type II toxin-antitoxin system prevent-host-death family antitoxin [Desulfurobacterium sp.]
MIVTANELKRRGIYYISELLKKFENVFISVRGKKFVILTVEEYEKLKELEHAIREAEKDLKEGRYVIETALEHFKRLGI